MSKLLIDDKPVMVLPKLAIAIGLNEAIVLQQVHYWLETYESADKSDHYHDGKWWVYNTKEEWTANFPWWSENTIWRALTNLRDLGILTTGNYNKKGYDRTLWYTINYAILPKWENGFTQNGKMDLPILVTPIPETNTETTPENFVTAKNAVTDASQDSLPITLVDEDTTDAMLPEDAILFDAINKERTTARRRRVAPKFATLAQKERWRAIIGLAQKKYNGSHNAELARLVTKALERGITDKGGIIAYVGGCFKDVRAAGEEVVGW